jgi:MSHA pilin protein MshD
MRTETSFIRPEDPQTNRQGGFTLMEVIVFIVVVAIAMGALLAVFNESVVNSVDPAVRIKALEKAQATLDEILARKFDENTPTGGVPACDSPAGLPCSGISPEGDFDDVGDYHGYVDNSDSRFPLSVSVSQAGSDFGLAAGGAKLITVNVAMPGGGALTLSAYKVNF